MKKRLILAVLFSMCIVFVLSTNTVNAAPGFYTATIQFIGTGSDGTTCIFMMSSTSWTGSKWFVSSAQSSNKMLAMGLTAVSLGKAVNIVIDNSLAEWQTIQQFYVTP
jgi:hypothetical protein